MTCLQCARTFSPVVADRAHEEGFCSAACVEEFDREADETDAMLAEDEAAVAAWEEEWDETFEDEDESS